MKNKGQSSLEFAVLVGFVMVAFALFFLVIRSNLSDKLDERINAEVKEVAWTVKNEVDLASDSMEGYSRNFTLPNQVYGREYDISVNESLVFVQTSDGKHRISLPLQNVSGQIIKFENNIRKENGEVKLN